MSAIWGLIFVQLTAPFVLFYSQSFLFPLLPSQSFLGVFGSEYREYYDRCIEKRDQQASEITKLTGTLREVETKLKDVDIYRDSLEQKESILRSGEESLENRRLAIDNREKQLEQRIFDFTNKLEEVSKNGGKAEQIIADNEILKNRVHDLEGKLGEERISSREELREEREYSRELLDKASRANQVLLFLGTFLVIIVLLFIGVVGFFYFKWLNGRSEPQKTDSLEARPVTLVKDSEALPPS